MKGHHFTVRFLERVSKPYYKASRADEYTAQMQKCSPNIGLPLLAPFTPLGF